LALDGNDATRRNVEDEIRNLDPDLIIHYGHGGDDKLFGQFKEPVLECTVGRENVYLLSSAVVATVSCSSAKILGPEAVRISTRDKKAYLGYVLPMCCVFGYRDYFTRAANAAIYALIEGKDFQTAKDIGYQKYTDEIYDLLDLDDPYVFIFVVPIMLWDRYVLKVVGDDLAKAQK